MPSAIRKAVTAFFIQGPLARMAAGSQGSLVWIDCEMTGLNRKTDRIMSLCCLITDADLNLLDQKGYEAIVYHDKATLDRMDDWCTKTHGESGLTRACLDSTTSSGVAAAGLLSYVKEHVPEPRKALLAGNSVHVDKEFLSRPPYDTVLKHLHYRILDVSSIKEAALRWAPEKLEEAPKKKSLHWARDDILESIEEARFYRKAFFR